MNINNLKLLTVLFTIGYLTACGNNINDKKTNANFFENKGTQDLVYRFKPDKITDLTDLEVCQDSLSREWDLRPLNIDINNIYNVFKQNGYEIATKLVNGKKQQLWINTLDPKYKSQDIYIYENFEKKKAMYDISLIAYEMESNLINEITLFLNDTHEEFNQDNRHIYKSFDARLFYPSLLIQSTGEFNEMESKKIAYQLIKKHIDNLDNYYDKCGSYSAETTIKRHSLMFGIRTSASMNSTYFNIYRIGD